MLGQVERDGLDGGNAERERVDAGDLHDATPSRERWTADGMYHDVLSGRLPRHGAPGQALRGRHVLGVGAATLVLFARRPRAKGGSAPSAGLAGATERGEVRKGGVSPPPSLLSA